MISEFIFAATVMRDVTDAREELASLLWLTREFESLMHFFTPGRACCTLVLHSFTRSNSFEASLSS